MYMSGYISYIHIVAICMFVHMQLWRPVWRALALAMSSGQMLASLAAPVETLVKTSKSIYPTRTSTFSSRELNIIDPDEIFYSIYNSEQAISISYSQYGTSSIQYMLNIILYSIRI